MLDKKEEVEKETDRDSKLLMIHLKELKRSKTFGRLAGENGLIVAAPVASTDTHTHTQVSW